MIRKHVVRLFGNKLISVDVYNTAKRAALAELQACHLEGLPDRRKVELWYRGCAFHTTITCLGDEVEHKFNVELKAHAAASNLIPKLFCEDDLVEVQVKHKEVAIQDCLLRGPRAARTAANHGLQGEKVKDGSTISAYLAKKEKNLVAIDSVWKVDCQWMTSMVGEAGERRLEQKCMDILPTATKDMSLTSCIQRAQMLRDSPLCAFCSSAAQGAVHNLIECLSMMLAGKAPSIRNNATDFMKKVLCRLKFFCKHGKEPGISGAAAVVQHLKDLSGKGAFKCSIADIEPIVVFAWLLSKEEQAQAAGLVKDVLSNARAESCSQQTYAMPSSQASSQSSVKKKSSASKPQRNEVQDALDMFG